MGADQMEEESKKYPEGYFTWAGMALGTFIFSAIGLPLWIVLGNPGMIGVGPAIGVSLGMAAGSALEAKYKKEGKIRPRTEEEEKRRKLGVTAGFIVLALLTLLGFVFFLRVI